MQWLSLTILLVVCGLGMFLWHALEKHAFNTRATWLNQRQACDWDRQLASLFPDLTRSEKNALWELLSRLAADVYGVHSSRLRPTDGLYTNLRLILYRLVPDETDLLVEDVFETFLDQRIGRALSPAKAMTVAELLAEALEHLR